MNKRISALILALVMLLTPAFAEDEAAVEKAETSAKAVLSPYQQENIVRQYAHTLADNYYYGVSDENLLYSVICATIENDGVFDLDLALAAMIDTLHDSYAEYYTPEDYSNEANYYEAEFFGIGVVITAADGGTVIDTVYSGGPADVAGLRAGDKIIAVDGTDTQNMTPAQTRELMTGEENSPVEITVIRGEETITVVAIRQRIAESHSSMKILDGGIAYIDVDSFTASLPEDFDRYLGEIAASGIGKVIIDLRDNGGGDINAAMEVAKKLIPAGAIAKFKYKEESLNETIYSENVNEPRFKLLVMVNENTASASEFLAMALQSRGRAKLLGEVTFGKGCVQLMTRTPTGSGLKFTFSEYYSINDERIQGRGLMPDILVENRYEKVDVSRFGTIVLENLNQPSTTIGVEQRLNALNLLAESEVDGFYNERTEAAVRVFQQVSGLEETGVVDFYTALALNDFEYNVTKVVDVQMEKALEYFK